MLYTFKQLTPTEFTVENYRIYKDSNGSWIANPPIESSELQLAVNNYINAKENRVQTCKKISKPCSCRLFRKLRARTGIL